MPDERNRRATFRALVTFLILLAGCTLAIDPADSGSEDLTRCEDPRPEICTLDYTPVCGEMESGEFKTYANGCTACANKDVVGFRPGSCPHDVSGSAE